MVRIRSTNDIILTLIDFFRSAQPNLDTKPGTVARDVIIDGPSTQLARLYEELNSVSTQQSLRLSLGADLDRIAQNFGAIRQQGARSTGPALLTFTSLEADIVINAGDIVTAKNGATFKVLNGLLISVVQESFYRSTAAKFRSDLDFVGITDEFAAEVIVEAVSSGIQGNVSKFTLNGTSIPNISNVTNVFPFSGGREPEDDAAFRNRIFAIFSGSNTGTALGYRNAVLADPAVIDVLVIEPGDDLMTRDGTTVFVSEDGTRTIVSEGTGGKVDVIVFGTRLQGVIDSFIFRDLSNTGDPTNSANDFVLGQIAEDAGKTVTRKRLDNLETGILPSQPVNNIISVSGSLSGANFVEQDIDELGRVTGNFSIIRDTGEFAGSPWGFDRLHFISDRISRFPEDKTKSTFNSQDPLTFTDLLQIQQIQQDVSIINENSSVSASDRSSVQLSHFPVKNVTRVFNSTTGERYVVSDQNPDGDEDNNETGRIVITGQTLPAVSDILQVDYSWVFDFDPSFDFDDRTTNSNPRAVQDSVDWGFSNAVRREQATLVAAGSVLTATVAHPITAVISVNVFSTDNTTVTLINGRLAVVVSTEVTSVISVVRDSDGSELFDTSDDDGTFSGTTIFLPTDTVAVFGDNVSVVYNAIDVFNAATQGSFSSNIITIVPSADATAGTLVECNYIANISELLPSTLLPALPAIRSSNAFDTTTSSSVGSQPTTHIFNIDGSIAENLRQAPSNLGLTVAGSISTGVITVSGVTILRAADIIFAAPANGLKQNISSAIKDFLNISSSGSVPSNVKLARITKFEKVTTTSSLDVLSVDNSYDIKGYALFDNSFVKGESIIDSSLTTTEVVLPSTPDNINNAPEVGDRIRISFHIITENDSENVSFGKAGTLFTQKRFAIVDTIAISSGFTSGGSSAATLTITNLNQPNVRSRYKSFYDYLAPKSNERITINYNFDKLISDATFLIEDTRPINADVLAKAATAILVDVTMNIVVTTAFINQTTIVQQNVQDAVTNALNAGALGTIVDSSDLINTAYSVEGVDRARILFFNRANESGSVLSIEAQKNEFIVANTVTINIEER